MAATAVSYSALTVDGNLADPAGTTVASEGTIANAVPELTVLRVTNGSTAGSLVIKAGDQPPAIAAGQGDLTVAVGASKTVFVGPLDSSRFLQSDGSLSFTNTQSLTVTAFKVARH